MKRIVLITFLLFTAAQLWAQNDTRVLLRGKVLYRNVSVPNENVINATSEMATITSNNGEYEIRVKVGDKLAFTAVNYQLKVVIITEEILQRNRLVVEVKEKITELEEVVVTPDDQERYIQLKNEEFKQFEYEIDRGTKVENIAQSRVDRGLVQDGLNFAGIFKAIMKGLKKNKKEKESPLKVSEVMRQIYDDKFFVVDLKLPQDKIDAFLFYCDTHMPAKSLLKKENEFELIDFLVTHSKTFLEEINDKK